MRTAAYALLGALGVLLACELVLRALPVSTASLTGYYLDPAVITYPPGHSWKSATGWDLRNAEVLQANNAGFVAHRDFLAGQNAVALVGDSFVEASMLEASDRPGVQLERALAGRPVYAMGAPGTSLLDYAERIRLASTRWDVRDVVVLMEVGDVKQSLCGSGNIHSPCLDKNSFQPRTELRGEPGILKRWLRHSAVAQYLVSQLKIDFSRLLQQALRQAKASEAGVAPVTAKKAAANMPMVEAVAKTFFARALPHVKGRLVIIVDANRSSEILDPERSRFIELATAAGAQVVDAAPIYRNHYASSTLSLEVGPYDSHLNALGLGLLMEAAAKKLR